MCFWRSCCYYFQNRSTSQYFFIIPTVKQPLEKMLKGNCCTAKEMPVVLCTVYYFWVWVARWFPWLCQGPALGHINAWVHTMLPFTASATLHVSLTRIMTLCTARSPQPAYRNTNIATEEQNAFWAFFFPSFQLRWIKFHRVSMWTALMH